MNKKIEKSISSTTILSYKKNSKKKIISIICLLLLLIILFVLSLFVSYNDLGFIDVIKAIFRVGSEKNILRVYNIRLPRVLAALIAGMGLSLSGCMMQAVLKNPMASPSTLGVSNAAVFGANIAIIVIGAGVIQKGNGAVVSINNPYLVSSIAFIFSLLAVILILLLAKIKKFSSETVVLAGIAVGAIFTALTTIVQFFSTDTEISSAVYWTFGNLSRATYLQDLIMFIVVACSFLFFYFNIWKLNALSSGEEMAKSLGIRTELLTCITLLLASLITAICVSFLGIIGFIGLVAPQIMKRIVGTDYRYLIPSSMLCGACVLLLSDMIGRVIIPGVNLPVGAITSLLGGPMFIYILLKGKEKQI